MKRYALNRLNYLFKLYSLPTGISVKLFDVSHYIALHVVQLFVIPRNELTYTVKVFMCKDIYIGIVYYNKRRHSSSYVNTALIM